MVTATADIVDLAWANLVGQTKAKSILQAAAASTLHAYMFVGPAGSGSLQAAKGFAGLVLAGSAPDSSARERAVRLAAELKHPDVVFIEPEGSTLRVSEAEQAVRAASISPTESSKKVIILPRVDAIEENAIGKLLKVIEEPSESTVFVLLAQEAIPEIVTIASRCVRVDFAPYSVVEIETFLRDDGLEADRASVAALASGGDLDRARLLASDDELSGRAEMWASLPAKLDGRGSTVAGLVADIRDGMDAAVEPLIQKQATELEELDKRASEFGERGSGRSVLVAKHKREARRLRVDEIRFGFATLARHYRDQLVQEPSNESVLSSLQAIQSATESLVRNPNESLLLQSLFYELS